MSLLEGEVRGGMEAEVEARTVPGRGEDEAKTGLRLGENGAKWSAGIRVRVRVSMASRSVGKERRL